MNRLSGKVALITGGNAGIGESIAKLFADEGASVVVTGRRQAELDRVVREIALKGGKAVAVAGSVTDDGHAHAAVQQAIASFGKVDVLVNNAGVGDFGKRLHEMDDAGWAQVLDATNSPAQLHGAIAEMGHLLEGKLSAMENQYQQGMGTSAVKVITPDKKIVWTYDVKPEEHEIDGAEMVGTDRVVFLNNGNPTAKIMVANIVTGKIEKEVTVPLAATANMKEPRYVHMQARRMRLTPQGTALIAYTNANKVAEYDENGKEVWSATVSTPWLDGKHTVFGVVLEGMDVVKKIESFGSQSGRPSKTVTIVESGQL